MSGKGPRLGRERMLEDLGVDPGRESDLAEALCPEREGQPTKKEKEGKFWVYTYTLRSRKDKEEDDA